MNKKLVLLAFLPFLLGGCGENPGDNPGTQEPAKVQYIVKFDNTNLANLKVDEGYMLSKPADPTKAEHTFMGWYSDAQLTKEVSFPIKINSDLTIYAKFFSNKEAFKLARKNTIGESIPGYEYDYNLEISAGYMNSKLSGKTVGNTKYCKNSNDVTFYDVHENSGALFNDGTKYSIKRGNSLHEISVDEKSVVKKYKIFTVDSSYTFDSSSFAKAVFEYADDKLKEIKATAVADEYSLKTSFNFSSGISLIGNYINHPIIEKIIGELPETSVNTGMYVTFSGDKLKTYRYEMQINVADVELSLKYSLSFKNIGSAPIITPIVFNDTYVSSADVANLKNEISSYLNAYKALEHSSYDFKVTTAVDFPKKFAINSTEKGFTKRKVTNTDIYYLNDYEVDTDHKNADLYKASGLADCHAGRCKLTTGEVYNLKKKVLGGYNIAENYPEAITHNDEDNYYLFDVFGMISNVTFVQKVVNPTKNTTTYAIGADTSDAANVLNKFNNLLRLNPLGESTIDVKAFGTFDTSSVTVKNFKFKIIVVNGALSEITLDINGKMTTCFPGSRDFTLSQDASFKLGYELEVTDDAKTFESGETVNKVK